MNNVTLAVLVSVCTLLLLGSFSLVNAAISDGKLIERGMNYELHANPDGSNTAKLGLPMWVYDSGLVQWVPVKVIEGDGEMIVQTGTISAKFLNEQVYFYDSAFTKFDNPIKEQWILKDNDNVVEKRLHSIDVEQYENKVYVTQIFSTEVGTLEVKYIFSETGLKHEITLTASTSGLYTLSEQWSMKADNLMLTNGKEVSLMYDDFTLSKSEYGDALKNLQFSSGGLPVVSESTALGWDKFQFISVERSGSFVTSEITYGEWSTSFTLDPTTTVTSPTFDGHFTKSSGGSLARIGFANDFSIGEIVDASCSLEPGTCILRGVIEFDTSAIPDTATVLYTVLRYSTISDAFSGNIIAGAIWAMANHPSAQPNNVAGNNIMWTDARDGTQYVSPWDPPASTDPILQDLGTQANTDLQNQLASNQFSLGFDSDDNDFVVPINNARRIAALGGGLGTEPTLEVTYRALGDIPPVLSSISDSPDPFSPDGDGIKDTTDITFDSDITGTYYVDIQDSDGVIVARLPATAPTTQASLALTGNSQTWDGKDLSGSVVPDGTYTCLIIAEGSASVTTCGTITVGVTTPQVIGGELIPIDTAALLLAGVQTNIAWMIPVIVSVIGIGIVIARKF